jgi:hypothetical protein
MRLNEAIDLFFFQELSVGKIVIWPEMVRNLNIKKNLKETDFIKTSTLLIPVQTNQVAFT